MWHGDASTVGAGACIVTTVSPTHIRDKQLKRAHDIWSNVKASLWWNSKWRKEALEAFSIWFKVSFSDPVLYVDINLSLLKSIQL